MNDEKIVNRVNPTDNEDAVTKKYVDEKTKQNKKKNRNNRFILFFVTNSRPAATIPRPRSDPIMWRNYFETNLSSIKKVNSSHQACQNF